MITLNEVEINCCRCGCTFWITKQHDDELLRTKKFWFCPNGHSQHYTGKTDKVKLEEAETEKKRYYNYYVDEMEKVNKLCKSISSYKGVIAKLKKTKKKKSKKLRKK